MTESRVKKSLLNAKVNLVFYVLTLVLTFFSRKIFFNCLGTEFVGFTTTLQNLLGFLNLAELGIGAAIAFILYKPLYDVDQNKICEIISILGYLYRRIGIFICIVGFVLSFFLPLIFPKTEFSFWFIYCAYYSYLASSLIGYLINYRQNLLAADQRNYIISSCFQGCCILKILVQMSLAFYFGNYYAWIGVELLFGIIYSVILNRKINQIYPWLNSNLRQGRNLLKKYPEVTFFVKQVFFHKLGSVALQQITPFLTYAFTSLSVVALYSNYSIITGKLGSLYCAFMDGTNAGVGNLVAEGNICKIKKIFWELTSIRYFIGSICSFCIYMLTDSFISLWLGKSYILDNSILGLVCIGTYIGYTRGAIDQFIHGYGLFWDVWAPVAELVINIAVACFFGYCWGLQGVLLGGIVSQIIIAKIWKPWFLYHYGFRLCVWDYVIRLIAIYLCVAFPLLTEYYFIKNLVPIDFYASYLNWIIYAFIVFSSCFLLTFTCMICFLPSFRSIFMRLYNSWFLRNKSKPGLN